MSQFRITAEGWDGIFLFEEEAARALAGHQLPVRILDDRRVSNDLRFRAASSPAEQAAILGGNTRVTIVRWKEEPGKNPVRIPSVKLDVYRTKTWDGEDDPVIVFYTSIGGRSYNAEDLSAVIDAATIAARLIRAAEAVLASDNLVRKATGMGTKTPGHLSDPTHEKKG